MDDDEHAYSATDAMKSLEKWIERGLLASRWILVVFFLVLAASLALYAFSFLLKFAKIALKVQELGSDEMILAMLNLIDASLVASLIFMVMISGYENFVSKIDSSSTELSWLGKIDTGSLKVKIASAIVAISSIHLLGLFLDLEKHDNRTIMWTVIIHLAFIVSALCLAWLDRIMSHGPAHAAAAGDNGGGYAAPNVPISHGSGSHVDKQAV